jgi:transposase
MPDWTTVYQELKRKDVTKQLLWEEYTARYLNRCYSYSYSTASLPPLAEAAKALHAPGP